MFGWDFPGKQADGYVNLLVKNVGFSRKKSGCRGSVC